jgi:anti-sigma B factor antagonist
MELDVTWEERAEGMFVVRPEGFLDSNTYTVLEDVLANLIAPSTRVLAFDMGGLEYISSAGLRVLFKAAKAVEGHGGAYVMSNLKPQIQKVFDIINALPSMRVFKDLQEVDAYLDTIQKREIARLKEEPAT